MELSQVPGYKYPLGPNLPGIRLRSITSDTHAAVSGIVVGGGCSIPDEAASKSFIGSGPDGRLGKQV